MEFKKFMGDAKYFETSKFALNFVENYIVLDTIYYKRMVLKGFHFGTRYNSVSNRKYLRYCLSKISQLFMVSDCWHNKNLLSIIKVK